MSKAAEARRQRARQDKLFEETLRENFKKVQTQAIAAGSYAMCRVILEKAMEEGKTDTERLQNIIDFCSVTVRNRNAERDAAEEGKPDEV